MKKPFPSIIDAHDARLLMNHPDVIFVDARGGPEAYQRFIAGHLRDALFVDLEKELSDKSGDPAKGGRHPLPAPEAFDVLLAQMGIHPSNHVIVYDDNGGANAAARFWWMLNAAGHNKVQVVDGGYYAIKEVGMPVSSQISQRSPVNEFHAVKEWQLPTVTIKTVAEAVKDQGYLVIDVREPFRFKGEREPIDLVAGHIPGAVNMPYSDNLQPDGTFKSPDVLSRQYQKLISNRDPQKVIVHCGSGVTACHTLLAMDYAGIKGSSLYVGSWSEWSRNDRPVAREEQ